MITISPFFFEKNCAADERKREEREEGIPLRHCFSEWFLEGNQSKTSTLISWRICACNQLSFKATLFWSSRHQSRDEQYLITSVAEHKVCEGRKRGARALYLVFTSVRASDAGSRLKKS